MEKVKKKRVARTPYSSAAVPAVIAEVQAMLGPRPPEADGYFWKRVVGDRTIMVPLGSDMYWTLAVEAGPAKSLALLSTGTICVAVRDSDEQGSTYSAKFRRGAARRADIGAEVHDVTAANVFAAIAKVFALKSVYQFIERRGATYQKLDADREKRSKAAELFDAILSAEAAEVIRSGSGSHLYTAGGATVHISSGDPGTVTLALRGLTPEKALRVIGALHAVGE